MANFFADGVEINIEDGHWRLYNMQGANSLSPFFDSLRGTGLLNYVAAFGEARGLPGTVLAGDYVKAIVVGYDEKSRRWLLGLQLQMKELDKPRFVELVRWPAADNDQIAAESHQAGRILAEYIGCPLKLFGSKKAPMTRPDGTQRSGNTGMLEPLNRQDIDPQRVRLKSEQIDLPLAVGGVWLGSTKTTLNLRISKDADQGKPGYEAPTFGQCVMDREGQMVRMMPPTGFLGLNLGSQGRVLKFQEIRNVEVRHTVLHDSTMEKDEEGIDTAITNTNHIYGLYLTLANESMLLAQLRHVSVGQSARHRAKTGISAVGKGNYNPEREMAFLRRQELDQKQHDMISNFAEAAGTVIAAYLGKPMMKTDVGEDA